MPYAFVVDVRIMDVDVMEGYRRVVILDRKDKRFIRRFID